MSVHYDVLTIEYEVDDKVSVMIGCRPYHDFSENSSSNQQFVPRYISSRFRNASTAANGPEDARGVAAANGWQNKNAYKLYSLKTAPFSARHPVSQRSAPKIGFVPASYNFMQPRPGQIRQKRLLVCALWESFLHKYHIQGPARYIHITLFLFRVSSFPELRLVPGVLQ